jgi:hypothetical protein
MTLKAMLGILATAIFLSQAAVARDRSSFFVTLATLGTALQENSLVGGCQFLDIQLQKAPNGEDMLVFNIEAQRKTTKVTIKSSDLYMGEIRLERPRVESLPAETLVIQLPPRNRQPQETTVNLVEHERLVVQFEASGKLMALKRDLRYTEAKKMFKILSTEKETKTPSLVCGTFVPGLPGYGDLY